ncbi:MAG: F0F1 ATP synthase subunit epsilon [Methylococcaceae bacterium]
MSSFDLNVFDATHEQRFSGVNSFVANDVSGCFGIQAHHARFMTTLVFGLARFSLDSGEWQYLALPGAVAYFNNNTLTISTRHFLIDTDIERISDVLQQQLVAEETQLRATRDSLQRMEQAMLQRMWNLKRKVGGW